MAILTALTIGTGSVLWTFVSDHIRLAERVAFLERFGPGTGNRFTAEDGKRMEARIHVIEVAKADHDARANNLIGRWEQTFLSIDKRLDAVERDCRECREKVK